MQASKDSPQHLQLSLLPGAAPVTISDLSEFERLLKPRVDVPGQRLARFLELDYNALGNDAVATQKVITFIHGALKHLHGQNHQVHLVLDTISTGLLPEDHEWRHIFHQLNLLEAQFNDYKLFALERYHDYLLNTQKAIKQICDARFRTRVQTQICGDFDMEAEANTAPRALDSSDHQGSECNTQKDLVRMPKGVTVDVVADGQSLVEIWLAKRRYQINTRNGTALVDGNGRANQLHEGRNVIGRSECSDVIIDPAYVDVSRRHLILDLRNGRAMKVTDLSSGGTFIRHA